MTTETTSRPSNASVLTFIERFRAFVRDWLLPFTTLTAIFAFLTTQDPSGFILTCVVVLFWTLGLGASLVLWYKKRRQQPMPFSEYTHIILLVLATIFSIGLGIHHYRQQHKQASSAITPPAEPAATQDTLPAPLFPSQASTPMPEQGAAPTPVPASHPAPEPRPIPAPTALSSQSVKHPSAQLSPQAPSQPQPKPRPATSKAPSPKQQALTPECRDAYTRYETGDISHQEMQRILNRCTQP